MPGSSLEARVLEIEAREAIARTIALYGQFLDDRRFDEFGELFAARAVWAVPGMSLEGRQQIVEGLRELEVGEPGSVKHVSLHPVIALDGPDHARAWTDLLALIPDQDGWRVLVTGRYFDTFVCNDDRWQFAVRTAQIDPVSTLASFAPETSRGQPIELPPTPTF